MLPNGPRKLIKIINWRPTNCSFWPAFGQLLASFLFCTAAQSCTKAAPKLVRRQCLAAGQTNA